MLAYLLPLLSALDAPLDTPDLDGAIVCATVVDEKGATVYDRNGGLHVVPASNEKLYTAAFTLYELGPDYRPVTRFWKQPNRIVVDSQGDPTMSFDDLTGVAKTLQLDGSLSVFVKESYAPESLETWEIGDLPNRYAAPVAAFSADQAGFELWNDHGSPSLRPNRYGVSLKNARANGDKPTFAYDPLHKTLTYGGHFPNEVKRLDTLGVPLADEAAALILGKSMTRTNEVPQEAPTLSLTGKPMSEILATCLQHSDNNIAENLLLMGAQHEGPLDPEPYPMALKRLKNFLNRVVQIPAGQTSPQDGSGLTRSNLVTTRSTAALLGWAKSQSTFPVWKAALASPSVGTLSRRLAGIPFSGKTGSLSHVVALSGYLTTRSGKSLMVSVVLNNFLCSDEKARSAIDGFIRNLFEMES